MVLNSQRTYLAKKSNEALLHKSFTHYYFVEFNATP